MDRAARAQKLFDKSYFAAAIDEALLASQEPNADKTEMTLLVAKAMEKMRQHPQAMGYANRVLERSPDHARALAHRGSVLDRLLQRAPAKADLLRAVELDPDYGHAWENLFYVSYDTKDDATVDRALEQMERLGVDTGYHWRLRGARRLENGDREGAEADLRKSCLHKAGNSVAADVMANAGITFQNGDEHGLFAAQRVKDNPAQAIESHKKAVELGMSTPRRDFKITERICKLLAGQNRTEEAVATATALTQRRPDYAPAWLTLAAQDGKTESFQRAYELSEEDAAVAYARHLLSTDRAKEALGVCEKRLGADPDDADALAAQGDAHMALGDRDAAKAAWVAAEALGNGNAGNARRAAFGVETGLDHFDAALNLLDRRMNADAIAEFETAIDKLRKEIRVPGDQSHRYLSKSLHNSAFLRELKVDDSIIEPYLREAIELDPFYSEAMLALGNLCLRTNRVDEGLQWFERGGTADPSAGQPWFYRARHFADKGEHKKTVENATKAFEAYSLRGQGRFAADAVMMRGQANEALGKLHDAKADYDTAYDYGHPTGYAMGDRIRERIAVEDPKSDEAYELVEKVVERIEDGECPWAQIDFLDARVASSEKATALVQKLKDEEELDDEQKQWLVDFLQSS
ncbi:MAG: hypothetical protein KC776_41105 [Myxococcales bacterium]|nr:hypothetical protein [Myxococcales bacterium]